MTDYDRASVCLIETPRQEFAIEDITANARNAYMVAATGRGRSVTICGYGPSLATTVIPPTDDVWACNLALDYLVERGQRVTHAIVIDADDTMVECLPQTFDVTYFIASSVHPNFPARLRKEKRKYAFFHSFLDLPDPADWDRKVRGMSYEHHLYTGLYPTGIESGYGVNCGTRAVTLALMMGYDNIVVVGMDSACTPDAPPMPEYDDPNYAAWLAGLTLYADGRSPSVETMPVMLEAVIDGRRWHSCLDMVLSATCLARLQKHFPNRLAVLGDTLSNAILNKDDAFFAELPEFTGDGRGRIKNVGSFTRPSPLQE